MRGPRGRRATPIVLAVLLAAVGGVAGDLSLANAHASAATSLFLSISGPSSVFLGQVAVFFGNASGGTGPYGFDWALNGTPQTTNITGAAASSQFTLRPLVDGIYSIDVNVTDHSGVRTAQQTDLFVTGPSPVSASVELTPHPNNGTAGVHAVASGGTPPYEFVWSAPGAPAGWTTVSNFTTPRLAAGSYRISVTARDANGYEGSGAETIVSNPASSGAGPGWTPWIILGAVAGASVALAVVLLRRRRRATTV